LAPPRGGLNDIVRFNTVAAWQDLRRDRRALDALPGNSPTALASVGLVYAGTGKRNDEAIATARLARQRSGNHRRPNWWHDLHVGWKLAAVAVLIASQVYLHFLLILFPVAFLVPFVRQFWVQAVDIVFGGWYRSKHAARYQAMMARFRALPGCRQVVGWMRITRLRYLCAWRLWKYDPHYLRPGSHRHTISIVEPMRSGGAQFDRYVGRRCSPGRTRAAAATGRELSAVATKAAAR
jgi:hypothetical protein